MKEIINYGDICYSLSGRDANEYYLVVAVQGNRAFITNGRLRKVDTLKKKNIKHLKLVRIAALTELATAIQKGDAVGNARIYRAIAQKIKED